MFINITFLNIYCFSFKFYIIIKKNNNNNYNASNLERFSMELGICPTYLLFDISLF